jgi:hypothetical protein
MKFLASILVYLLLAGLLFAGILSLMKGSAWLLIAGLIGYVIMLAKFGCLSTGEH